MTRSASGLTTLDARGLADELLPVGARKKLRVGEFDPLSGVILHEQMEVMPEAAEYPQVTR
jgi:hypothetical protein